MKLLFGNFEDDIDCFGIKRISIENDNFNNTVMKSLINRNIRNFLNPKNNYCFRFICMEKYYSEISDERSTIGMMDFDIMKIRMRNMVLKRREV